MRQACWIVIYALIVVSSFIISIQHPLCGDEELYAIAIKDAQQYGIMPYATYFGAPMFWKPPLTFTIYGILTKPLMSILPETIALRMPSLLFMILWAVLFYLLVKDELGEERTKYAVLLLLLSPAVFGFGTRILTDIPAFAFLMLMLYSTKEFAKAEKPLFIVLYMISLVCIGLTKSMIISVFAFGLSILYLIMARKTGLNTLKVVAAAGAFALIILTVYPFMFYEYWEKLLFSSMSDSARVIVPVFEVILRNFPAYLFLMIPYGIAALLFVITGFIKNKKLTFYGLWAVASLLLIISKWGILPWYTIFFVPALAVVIAEQAKNYIDKMLIVLVAILALAIQLFAPLIIFSYEPDTLEMIEYAKHLGENRTLLITRISDGVVNGVYNLPYRAVVTPEIGMSKFNKTTNKFHFIGIKEKALKPENMRGLIYDYDNESLLPQFTDKLAIKDSYIPPVARTRKYWEGGFDVIIAKNDYAEGVMKVAPEYKVVYTTSNNIYYVLMKE